MFSRLVGLLYAVVAIIFLVANSVILGMFGHKFGHGEWGKLLFAVVAASVPWALAPHLHVMAAKRRMYGKRQWFRGMVGTVPFLVIYVLFVAYNVLGGTGATAFARTEAADERKHVIGETTRLEDQRTALKAQLDAIPKHRPKDAVEAFISKTKLHPFWKQTNECKDEINSKGRRNYCAEIDTLIAEKASGEKAEVLLTKISAIDEKLNDGKRSVSASDPQVEFLRSMTGLTDQQIMMILLLATPLILEAGALYWGKQALELLNIHVVIEAPEIIKPERPRLAPPSVARVMAASDAREAIQLHAVSEPVILAKADPALQRVVYDRFWSEWTRPMANNMMTALATWQAYAQFAARQRSTAYDFETFMRTAGEQGLEASSTNGSVFLHGFILCEPMGAE